MIFRFVLLLVAIAAIVFALDKLLGETAEFKDVDSVYKFMEQGLELVKSHGRLPVFYDPEASSFFEWTNLAYIKQSSYASLRTGDMNTTKGYKIDSELGFSPFANKLIPLDRLVPDHRPGNCKFWHYNPNSMPTVSVIMAFTKEDITVLARSIYSILLHTPRHLLAEIVLVIDCDNCLDANTLLSDLFAELYRVKFSNENKFVYERLAAFRAEMPWFAGESWNTSQVVLTATGTRSGLGASLNLGATRATGEVLVFLKSCVEVSHNWLPPLLAPIMDDPKTVSLLTTGNILPNSFGFTEPPNLDLTFWNWGFYTRTEMADFNKEVNLLEGFNLTLPYDTGLLNSAQFAISRTFFSQIGRFSLNYLITNEINFDFTLRVLFWNGRIVRVPCSIIYVLKKTIDDPMMEVFEEFFTRTHNYIYEPKCFLKQLALIFFTEKNVTNFFLHHPTLSNFSCVGRAGGYNATHNLPDSVSFNFLSTHNQDYQSYHVYPGAMISIIHRNTFVANPPLELLYFGKLMNTNYMVCLSSDLRKDKSSLRVISSYCSDITLKPFRLDSNFRLRLEEVCIYPNSNWNKLEAQDCFWDQWKANSIPWQYNKDTLQLQLNNHCVTFSQTEGIILALCNSTIATSQTWIWA